MTQLHFSDAAHARATDPDTSHAAARSVTPHGVADSQRAVLAALERNGALTDEHIYAAVQRDSLMVPSRYSPSRLRTARKELVAQGAVVQAGYGVTARGRKCCVWRLA